MQTSVQARRPAPDASPAWEKIRVVRPAADMGQIGADRETVEKATRRGNYDSGSDYVLEYGELRFSFNEEDFAQRVEQAAVKLDFVDGGPRPARSSRTCSSSRSTARSASPPRSLGEHINEHWTELVGPASRSLVHWIRRLVFRGAWLDQRVKEGELDIVFDPDTQTLRLRPARARRRADRALARALLGPPRLPALVASASLQQLGVRAASPRSAREAASPPRPGPGRRAASAVAGAPPARRRSRSSSSLETRHSPASSAGRHPGRGELGVEPDQRALGRDHGALGRRRRHRRPSTTVAITVSEPAPGLELAPGAEQPLDLGDVAGRDREPRERVARPGPTSAPASASRRARSSASSASRTCSAGRELGGRGRDLGARAAPRARRSPPRDARRPAARSPRPPRRRRSPRARPRSSVVRPERGAARTSTRWPNASGASRSDRAGQDVGRRPGREPRAGSAATGSSSSNRERPRLGGSSPLTRSTWTRARWRSPRRGERAGPGDLSPGRSSQRRTWDGGDVDVVGARSRPLSRRKP